MISFPESARPQQQVLVHHEYQFFSHEENANDTLTALRHELPTHNINAWPDCGDAAALDYAICWGAPESFFDGATNLKAIFSLAAGVDHLLNHPNLPSNVPIIRLADAGMADKIAEYIHFGIIRWHRHFDIYAKQQAQSSWQPRADIDAADYRVGIMGMGVIGSKVATRLSNAGYHVTGWKRTPKTDNSIQIYAGDDQLGEFLSKLNALVCVLPLTPKTSGIINRSLLYQLPAGAHFINVGRGTQLVETDLLQALDNQQIAGAMLDVCETEPPEHDHPFWHHPDILLTPHIAGPTQLTQSVKQIADGIQQLESGVSSDLLKQRLVISSLEY